MYLYIFHIKNNLLMIKNSHIELIEKPLEFLENYKKEFDSIEIIASSNRIDTVIARLIQTSRQNISDKIKNKEILFNLILNVVI